MRLQDADSDAFDDGDDAAEGLVDVGFGRERAEGEADGTAKQVVGDSHRDQSRRRRVGAGGARGTERSGDAGEIKLHQQGVAVQVAKTDMRGLRESP